MPVSCRGKASTMTVTYRARSLVKVEPTNFLDCNLNFLYPLTLVGDGGTGGKRRVLISPERSPGRIGTTSARLMRLVQCSTYRVM